MAYKIYVVIDWKKYMAGYPMCEGCENLTVGQCGWFCGYPGDGCEYPEELVAKNVAEFGSLEEEVSDDIEL